jgi:hypothetical protein
MHITRALVAVLILVAAMPALAQDRPDPRVRRPVPRVRVMYPHYSGVFGRFFWGPQRTLLVVDDYIPEGRPLGISANYNYFDAEGRAYTDWNNGWSGGYGYGGGWPYVSTGGRDVAPPAETPKATSESALIEGRLRWRGNDVAGALACFKKAVADDLTSAAARLHMALALVATGDLKNADKALESALPLSRMREALADLNIEELFRNPKAREKFEARLAPASDGTGAVSVALAQHLLGLKEKCAKTLDGTKDPNAAKLRELLK